MYVLSPNKGNTWASTHKGRKREERNGRKIKKKKIPVGWRKRGRRPKFLDTQREKRRHFVFTACPSFETGGHRTGGVEPAPVFFVPRLNRARGLRNSEGKQIPEKKD